MRSIKYISIPEPCHQNWQDMIEAAGGRHCAHCCKTVTDFTAMTNQQIIEMISNSHNLCGRFENWQLDSVNRQLAGQRQTLFNWKKFSLAASLLFVIPVFKGFSQQAKTVKQVVHQKLEKKNSSPVDSLQARYAGYQSRDFKFNENEVKPVVVELPERNIRYVVGGISIPGINVEPERHYNSIYDWLLNIR
jgi:hypothetical protein